jgi:thioredoxin reductase (NADPH)
MMIEGLTAAIYAGRANLSPLVAAGETGTGMVPGGQLMITTEVENFPGFPEGVEGPDLIELMQKQAKKFGATIVDQRASEFELPAGGPFKVKVGQQWYMAESVILANGAAAKWLGAPDETKFINHGISACATCDGPLPVFRNKHLFVVGGGDSAIEEATFLTRFASKVTIIHRREQLRASKIMQQRAKDNPKIEFAYNTVITGYQGGKSLESISVHNTETGENAVWPASGLFMAIGHVPLTSHLQNAGIELDSSGYVIAKNHVDTNIEGVFTAGDVHDTHFRQAVTASGFGCMAAIAAERWIEAKTARL